MLTRADRRAEDVGIFPIVIPELKLCDIQREVFGGHLVKGPDHAALDKRPKAFDGLGVNSADDVLSLGVINRRVRKIATETTIGGPLIGAKQAHLVGNTFADEGLEGGGRGVGDHAGHNVTLTGDGANDDSLTRSASPAVVATLADVTVLGFAADEGFVRLDNTHEFLKILVRQSRADAVTHGPRGFIGTEAHDALDLKSGDTLFAGHHHVNYAEPLAKALVRVLEDSSDEVREPIAINIASVALPFEGHRGHCGDLDRTTTGAVHPIGPAVRDQIGGASVFVRKGLFELGDRHLVDAHGRLRFDERSYSPMNSPGQVPDNRPN
jgi:hypothetical protein